MAASGAGRLVPLARPGAALTPLWVALGGAAGALARYGIGGWVQQRAGDGFPWGTLAVNVLGCLLLGAALRAIAALGLGEPLRALIAVGLLGAFTTFSTFSYEAVVLLQAGEWRRALLYTLGSVTLGVAAVVAGHVAAGRLVGEIPLQV